MPTSVEERSWFQPSISAVSAEQLLMREGKSGSFLVRNSQSEQGVFSLTVRIGDAVTHIRIHNDGDCFDLNGGETFATLSELIRFYMEGGSGHGTLKEKDGRTIELKYPVPTADHGTERFFHHDISSGEAERVLGEVGLPVGTFLVRQSQRQAGNFVLSVKTGQPEPAVLHIVIYYKDDQYDVADGNHFNSLVSLVNHYRGNSIKDRSGIEVQLKQAVDMTHLRASEIEFRIAILDKEFTCAGVRRSGFWEEFEHLQSQENMNSKIYHRSYGEKPENKRKNRFKNILPYDHSRVRLKDGDPKVAESDYINANYLEVADASLPSGKRRYIACQGCLQHTVVDFWRLIVQEKCSVIVMITKLVEDGKNKCFQYWPDEDDRSKTFDVHQGSITVTLGDTVTNSNFIKRTLTVDRKIDKGKSKGTTSLVVEQYHFMEWRDKKIPSMGRIESILTFIQNIDDRWRIANFSGPLVVHCSAGIGRTGTFVVIDSLLSQIRFQGVNCEIDVAKTILDLRSQRSGLVQTDLQYKFIYIAIRRYVENLSRPVESPMAAQTAMLYENITDAKASMRAHSAKPPAPLKPSLPSPVLKTSPAALKTPPTTHSKPGTSFPRLAATSPKPQTSKPQSDTPFTKSVSMDREQGAAGSLYENLDNAIRNTTSGTSSIRGPRSSK